MTRRDDSEPRGDLVDQATDAVFAAEQAAIRAALAGREVVEGDAAAARVDGVEDEPRLDLGDGDDSDDAVHAGGDDVALSGSGGPREDLSEEAVEEVEVRAPVDDEGPSV